jgi:hypothetical protein
VSLSVSLSGKEVDPLSSSQGCIVHSSWSEAQLDLVSKWHCVEQPGGGRYSANCVLPPCTSAMVSNPCGLGANKGCGTLQLQKLQVSTVSVELLGPPIYPFPIMRGLSWIETEAMGQLLKGFHSLHRPAGVLMFQFLHFICTPTLFSNILTK